MFHLFFRLKAFLVYLVKSKGGTFLHSPFVYKFYIDLIQKKRSAEPDIEAYRTELIGNIEIIDVHDFKTHKDYRRSVSSIVRSSTSTKNFSIFLKELCEFMGIESVIETGTSFGINALYISRASSIKKIITIEGSPIIAKYAERAFDILGYKKIEILNANVYSIFESQLERINPDMVFLDADHRASAIDFYLKAIRKHCPKIKCIVVHDIYWSEDMSTAWDLVIKDPQFNLTIDLYQAGVIIPNHPAPKQHFTLRFL